MKDPRRAYDRNGSMIEPVTVASHLVSGLRLVEVWCNPCSQHVEVETDAMPPGLAIVDIALRFRCSACGGKQLTSRMSIPEFYRHQAGPG